MWPPSLVRERCARAAPPQLKLEFRDASAQSFGRLCRGISISIFEASRMNALALIISVGAARLEAGSLETNRGYRQRGVRRKVHARGLAARGNQAGTQRGNHRAVIGAQGELRDD